MKLYSFYNNNFSELHKRFRESFKDKEIELLLDKRDIITNGVKCGGFDIWLLKTKHIISILENCSDEYFVYSDIDIQFFRPIKDLIEISIKNYDIVFQKEELSIWGDLNIGFMAIRCNNKTRNFWGEVLKQIELNKKHDQQIVNELLSDRPSKLLWKRVLEDMIFKRKLFPKYTGNKPLKFNVFPNSVYMFQPKQVPTLENLPDNIYLHHATYATSQTDKLNQMDVVLNLLREKNNKLMSSERYFN